MIHGQNNSTHLIRTIDPPLNQGGTAQGETTRRNNPRTKRPGFISSQEDAVSLQDDFDSLQEWERDWQMAFNPDKCEHIRVTNKWNIVQSSYKIHGQVLKETTKAKYLGVTIDSKLTWNSHVDLVTRPSPFYRGTCQPVQGMLRHPQAYQMNDCVTIG